MSDFTLEMIDSLCQIVIAKGLVPTATLAAPAHVGDTSITITVPTAPALTPFLWRNIVSWWDGSGEDPVRVASSVAAGVSVIPLDFTGHGRTGLQYAHTTGTVIAGNLVDTIPVKTTDMFGNGWPVVAVFVLDRNDRAIETQGFMPQLATNIGYQLPATPLENQMLDAQLFVRRQTRRAELDLQLLVDELQDNNRVIVGTTAHAMEVNNFVRSLRLNIENTDQPLWEQYLTMTVSGPPRQMNPRFTP